MSQIFFLKTARYLFLHALPVPAPAPPPKKKKPRVKHFFQIGNLMSWVGRYSSIPQGFFLLSSVRISFCKRRCLSFPTFPCCFREQRAYLHAVDSGGLSPRWFSVSHRVLGSSPGFRGQFLFALWKLSHSVSYWSCNVRIELLQMLWLIVRIMTFLTLPITILCDGNCFSY